VLYDHGTGPDLNDRCTIDQNRLVIRYRALAHVEQTSRFDQDWFIRLGSREWDANSYQGKQTN
jgi:hypothetical protein